MPEAESPDVLILPPPWSVTVTSPPLPPLPPEPPTLTLAAPFSFDVTERSPAKLNAPLPPPPPTLRALMPYASLRWVVIVAALETCTFPPSPPPPPLSLSRSQPPMLRLTAPVPAPAPVMLQPPPPPPPPVLFARMPAAWSPLVSMNLPLLMTDTVPPAPPSPPEPPRLKVPAPV